MTGRFCRLTTLWCLLFYALPVLAQVSHTPSPASPVTPPAAAATHAAAPKPTTIGQAVSSKGSFEIERPEPPEPSGGGTVEAIVAVCGLCGIVLTFFLTRWQIRKELEEKFDAELRSLRTPHYLALWKSTGLFPKYARKAANPTYATIKSWTEELRDWYFNAGGLYLSESSRDAYFRVQETMKDVLAAQADRPNEEEIKDPIYHKIRKSASSLRTSLSADLGTRTNPKQKGGSADKDGS